MNHKPETQPLEDISHKTWWALLVAAVLLGAFILANSLFSEEHAARTVNPLADTEREHLPCSLEGNGQKLVFHDFEQGNPADSASRLVSKGYGGRQSLRLNAWAPFSPGLWVPFKELRPGDSSWIRVTAYVWFTCPDSLAKCSLVATCNHQGINYKYMFVALEYEKLIPGRWNRVSLDYRIPVAPDPDDVLQAYFWYRGSGELLVDDIGVTYFYRHE